MRKEKRKEQEEKKKKHILLIVLCVILIAIIAAAVIYFLKNPIIFNTTMTEPVQNAVTVEGKKLVFKSNYDYNKKIEYFFKEDIVDTIKIYEQFEEKEKYETMLLIYNEREDIEITRQNEEELSIEIQKKDLGTDADLTYEEILNKYSVDMIDAYEVIY